MRLGLRISTILISCCVLINQGCTPEQSASEKNSYGTEGALKDKAVNNKDDEQPEVVQVVEKPEVVIVPVPGPRELPPLPFGGGGGSQGAIKPARTGNPDASGSQASCGNGEQETYARSGSCTFDIYGTTFVGSTNSLVGFNQGAGGAVGFTEAITVSNLDLGCTFGEITALEFDANGVLYGVGAVTCPNNPPTPPTSTFYRLLTLDCTTAVATLVQPPLLDVQAFKAPNIVPFISDLDFDSHGQLYAYGENTPSDELGTFNIFTGQYFKIGNTGLNEVGNGLASLNFPEPDFLFQAGQTLNRLNIGTGTASSYGALVFPAGTAPAVRAMDRDHRTKIVYVNLSLNGVNYLATLDRDDNNTVSFLNPAAPVQAPVGLRGITANRPYEECDGTDFELPFGTVCSSHCQLVETNCADLDANTDPIDNDFNGLANCDDPSCFQQTCNDEDGCTADDVCDNHPRFCRRDAQCDGPIQGSGVCNIEAGSCVCTTNAQCPLDSTCTGGTCLLNEVTCEGIEPADRCEDGNECTVDNCIPLDVAPFDSFACDSTFDTGNTEFGGCTPEGNCAVALNPDGTCPCAVPLNPDGSCPQVNVSDLCVLGRCVLAGNPATTPTCEATDRVDVLTEAGGCNDSNQCTVDICDQEFDENDLLTYDCENGNIEAPVPCNIGDNECQFGHCEINPANSISECVDLQDVPTICLTNEDCGPALQCVGLTVSIGFCSINIGTPCTVNADCPGGIADICIGAGLPLPGFCACDNGDDCSVGEACSEGTCQPAALEIALPCLLDITCGPDGSCNNTGLIPGECVCDDNTNCPIGTFCGTGGSCIIAGIAPSGTPCNDDDVSCTIEECNATGDCVPAVPPTDDTLCPVDTFCSLSTCTEFGCEVDISVGEVACTTGIGPACLVGVALCLEGGIVDVAGCVALSPPVLCTP